MAQFCMACGAQLADTAKFCHRCGTPRGAAPKGSAMLPWTVAGIALLCLLGFIVGQNFRRGPRAAATAPAATTRAPDISQLSPQQRADMLFNRVMTYVAEGKTDSVAFFSPMAIGAYEAMAPLNAHQRYDLGLLAVVSGDGVLARAQADSILREEPDHLLGLLLGMRAAGLQLDQAGRSGYESRFRTALPAERAKRLPEYTDHQADLDAAVRDMSARNP